MWTSATQTSRTPDHPREYGENFSTKTARLYLAGSSPRIRGEYLVVVHHVSVLGIIPANTGRIKWLFAHRVTTADHPREYGENCGGDGCGVEVVGSSPRIRGECTALSCVGLRGGIIPANTGRISTDAVSSVWLSDHPREYGENLVPSSLTRTAVGSSPRIRGEYGGTLPPGNPPGIIPANTGRIC